MTIHPMGIHTNLTTAQGRALLGITVGSGPVKVPGALIKQRYLKLLGHGIIGISTVNFGVGFNTGTDGRIWCATDEASSAPLDLWITSDVPTAYIKSLMGWQEGGAATQYQSRASLVAKMARLIDMAGVSFPADIRILVYGEFDDYLWANMGHTV